MQINAQISQSETSGRRHNSLLDWSLRTGESVIWSGRVIAVVVVLATAALVIAPIELVYNVGQLAIKCCRINEREYPTGHSEKLIYSLINKINQFTHIDPTRVLRKLEISCQDEIMAIQYLHDHFEFSAQEFQEILKGAHVYLDDGGYTYRYWLAKSIKRYVRQSSHPSDCKQYALRGHLVKEMLFGRKGNCTWFQLESSALRFGSLAVHIFDYIVYQLTSYNQGPFGYSVHCDNNPIFLNAKKSDFPCSEVSYGYDLMSNIAS